MMWIVWVLVGWVLLSAIFVAAGWAAKRRRLARRCRHHWRPNVAWSHLERCDGCGSDRPAAWTGEMGG